MTGIINVDKPVGMTSRRVVDVVARVAKTKRAGHAGTLDPLATGVLVVCLGWATRLVPYIQDRPKRYRAVFVLGQRSDTDDVTGEVEELAVPRPPTRPEIVEMLPRFTGRISQVPPAFSAVHVGGERAYEKARRGDEVELVPREVEVHRLELVAYDYPLLECVIDCGSGTYVRSLGRDLGRALGCGAVMSALVREAIGPFCIAEAVLPDELTPETLAQRLLAPLAAVSHLPRHLCTPADLGDLTRGRAIPCASGASPAQGSPVALVSAGGDLVGIAERELDEPWLRPRQVFITQ